MQERSYGNYSHWGVFDVVGDDLFRLDGMRRPGLPVSSAPGERDAGMIADEATLTRLAGLAQRGDRQAYRTLLVSCRGWLLRYFRRKVPPEQIEDLVQDTLLSLHRKLASYDPERSVIPWLAAIARYRFVDHLRAAYRSAANATFDEDMAIAHDDEPALTARLSLDRLFEALPDAQSRAIELVKIEGLSISEASASTGQSESLVKVNIHRGLKRLASLIERA